MGAGHLARIEHVTHQAASDPPRAHLNLVTTSGEGAAVPNAPLLPRIAEGDDRAVAECLRRYGSLVWSLARRWSAESGDAEDAAQEIFIDLWKTAARYDASRTSEAGWVAMVARRRLIDRARRRDRQPALDTMPDDFDVADEREQDLDRTWRAERARAVIGELPNAQRHMLELALLHGHTHEEIARTTGTPLGTVKSHIRRGLQRARELLATRAPLVAGDDR